MKQTYIGEHTIGDLRRMPFGAALEALAYAEELPSAPRHEPRPSAETILVRTGDVVTLENVFQHRNLVAGKYQSEAHVKGLTAALRNLPAGERALDPILVKSIDHHWICVDGHHRLKAYSTLAIEKVPAVEFEGSVREAVVEAGRGNSKAKLPLETNERMEAAWRITAADLASKNETRKATGASDGSIANMRRMANRLREVGADPSVLSYYEARDALNGGGPVTERGEAWAEQQVAQIADGLTQLFAKTGHRRRDFIAEALERRYPTVVAAIVERNALAYRDIIEALFRDEEEA